MKEIQKVIKYVAIIFGLYLAIMIISVIASVLMSIATGIYGIQLIFDYANISTTDVTKEFENIYNLDIDINSSNLEIKVEGNVFKVEASQINEKTKIEEENGTIEIEDTDNILYNNDSLIIVYIPEGTILQKIDLDLGAGNVEISGLNSNESKIECGAGQVKINDSALNDLELETGIGRLVFSGYITGKSKVNCGIGEIILNLIGEDYKIDVEKGIGNIKINDNLVNDGTILGNGENEISIKGGIGNIEVNM